MATMAITTNRLESVIYAARRYQRMIYRLTDTYVTDAELRRLPATFHAHDKTWLIEALDKLAVNYRKKAVERYAEAFEAAYKECADEIRRECYARNVANTRLRNFINRVNRIGDTELPPTAKD